MDSEKHKILTIIFTISCFCSAFGNETTTPLKNAVVQDSQEVQLADKTITYNRIETPVLQPQVPPVVIPPPPASLPTAEEQQRIDAWLAKRHEFLCLSATAYDNGITIVRWWRPEGQYLIWSEANFHYLTCSDFESTTATYSMMLSVGDESIQSLQNWNATQLPQNRQAIPQLPPLNGPRTGSRYQIISSPSVEISPEVVQSLDDLHHYYDANLIQLTQSYQQSEAARVQQEQWLKDHPPQPQNTVIQYFPIRSVHRTQP